MAFDLIMEKTMRILICTNHFYPENFRVNDIAFSLAREGHDVTVLTAIPDYPLGKYFDGYGVFKRRSETVNGVKVIRGFIIPRGKGGGLRLMLNYLSFFISSFFISLWLALRHHYVAIFVHETSPVMIGVPAVIVKKIRKCPLFFWVLDLWPESLQAAGGINSDVVLNSFTKLTQWIYKNSDKILISSKGFEKSSGVSSSSAIVSDSGAKPSSKSYDMNSLSGLISFISAFDGPD